MRTTRGSKATFPLADGPVARLGTPHVVGGSVGVWRVATRGRTVADAGRATCGGLPDPKLGARAWMGAPRGETVADMDDDPAAPVDRGRDRDSAGRARQARPRDELGRPLPYGAAGVEPVPEVALGPGQTLVAARALIEAGRPFSAHEVFEARWKAGPSAERDLWQGLAQICVGLTHAGRGNTDGATRLVERGAAHLLTYGRAGGPTYGLDLAAVTACAFSAVAGSA